MKRSLRVIVVLALVLVFVLSNVYAAKNQLVIGLLGDNETLNPVLSENFSETEVLDCLFSHLIRMNDKLQMEPELLTQMPTVSKDNLTYSFQLRKGVKFHDGVEVTSDDVKFLYDMSMAPGNAVPSREMWEKITKFEIIDKYNFKITINKPNAPWLENWCYTGWSILPKHILEKEFKEGNNSLTKGGAFSRNPVGSGPYRFVEWKTDQYVMLKKNPNYFIKGQPKIDTIVFKVVPDTNALLAQFKNNEIDVFLSAQPSQYKELTDMKNKGANIQVFKAPTFTYMHSDFNLNHPALKDKAVRQALCYAFPKQKFIDTVLEGIGTPADSNIVPMSWAYTSNVHKYDYDPGKAKKILDDAGWKVGTDGVREKNGVKLSFSMSTNAGNKTREKFEEIAKQEWEAIGAKITVQNYEAATFFGDILQNFKFDIAIFAWISGVDPDCLTLWHSKQIPTEANGQQGQNYVSYINPRIDTLLENGQTELNHAKRIKIYTEVQQILADDVPYMFVYYYNEVNAVTGSLKNFKPNATQASSLWNVAEWELK